MQKGPLPLVVILCERVLWHFSAIWQGKRKNRYQLSTSSKFHVLEQQDRRERSSQRNLAERKCNTLPSYARTFRAGSLWLG